MQISNPISGFLESGRKRSRELEKERAKEKELVAETRALSAEEQKRYLSGEVSEPQKRWLDESEKKLKEETSAYAERAGLSDKEEQDLLSQQKLERMIIESSMHENTWTKAVSSLGFTIEKTTRLLESYKKEQLDTQKQYTQLMITVAMIGAAAFTGGAAGAALLAGAVKTTADQAEETEYS